MCHPKIRRTMGLGRKMLSIGHRRERRHLDDRLPLSAYRTEQRGSLQCRPPGLGRY